MPPDVRIEHRYPAALPFLRQHGPDALAILHDLLAHAERRGSRLVVQASVRQIADRLGFLSKDTVHRRLRQLFLAGILRNYSTKTRDPFSAPLYVLDLARTGISLTNSPSRRSA